MKHKVFTVFDEKAGAHLPIFMMHREEMAQRVFGDCVNSADHAFAKHPADYTLFQIGEFDDSLGKLIPCEANRNLGNGVTYLRRPVDGEFILESDDAKE